ncbi:MAG: hypothetical protein J6T98_02840 [Salinivirgaceae bacterium]|nr:hypothetical protein [Salinivirgaceae bacterium]
MEKAIKSYLAPFGYKYNVKDDEFIKKINDDLTQTICYADATHNRKQYHLLTVIATVSSNLLNEILYQASDGMMNFRSVCASPAYLNTVNGKEAIHAEFIGERTMEENIAAFDRVYKEDVLQVFDKFKTTKDVLLSPLREELFNPYNRPYVRYYVPLAYYFNGEFDKAYEYIQERLDIEYKMIERFGPHESAKQTINTYEAIRKNLKQWIAERRQFKVDDEYLPHF